jgi:hypothetical protein
MKLKLMESLRKEMADALGWALAPSEKSLEQVDWVKWANHFVRNRKDRPEPRWELPSRLSSERARRLLPSLQQFELGDGGGPACLIAFNAESFRSLTPAIRVVVDAWFAEEREHSRLLGCAVARFDGELIAAHWSFAAFCLMRRLLGVRFELQVLLLTEIVSAAYYRVLKRRCGDESLEEMCGLILRDEAGHIAFHLDRLAAGDRSVTGVRRKAWEAQFRALGFVAAVVLWMNHGRCMRPLGTTNAEYFREVQEGLSSFVSQLDKRTRVEHGAMSAEARCAES